MYIHISNIHFNCKQFLELCLRVCTSYQNFTRCTISISIFKTTSFSRKQKEHRAPKTIASACCANQTLWFLILCSVFMSVSAGKVQWVKFLAEEYFLLAFPEARLLFLASVSLCKRDMFWFAPWLTTKSIYKENVNIVPGV